MFFKVGFILFYRWRNWNGRIKHLPRFTTARIWNQDHQSPKPTFYHSTNQEQGNSERLKVGRGAGYVRSPREVGVHPDSVISGCLSFNHHSRSRTVQTPAWDLPGCPSYPTVPVITLLSIIPTVHCRLISSWGYYLEKLFLEKPNKMTVAAGCGKLTHHGSEE